MFLFCSGGTHSFSLSFFHVLRYVVSCAPDTSTPPSGMGVIVFPISTLFFYSPGLRNYGLFVVPNCSRVDEFWVEMVMYVKATIRFIPTYEKTHSIDAKDSRKCLPAKFDGNNADLLRAEEALDPLSNDVLRGEADIGLGG